MKDNWQKDIHNRLGNYEINEPEGLWKDIRKEMAGANGGYVRNSKSSVTFRLRRMASVAAAASVALLLGYSIYSKYTYSERDASELARQQVYTKTIKSSVKSSFAAGDCNDFMVDNSSMSHITDMTRKSEKGKEISSSVLIAGSLQKLLPITITMTMKKVLMKPIRPVAKNKLRIQRKTMKM